MNIYNYLREVEEQTIPYDSEGKSVVIHINVLRKVIKGAWEAGYLDAGMTTTDCARTVLLTEKYCKERQKKAVNRAYAKSRQDILKEVRELVENIAYTDRLGLSHQEQCGYNQSKEDILTQLEGE